MKFSLSAAAMIAFLIFSETSAHAQSTQDGLYLMESLIGYQVKTEPTAGSVQEKTAISSETGLGYIISDWFYLGGIYHYTASWDKTSDGTGVLTNHQKAFTYYGPTIGYMSDTWFLLAHWFMAAEAKDDVTGDAITPYTGDMTGSGFGANVGYKLVSWTGFEIAPSIAYKNITYNNCRDPITGVTSSCTPAVKQSEIMPYVTFLFNFK